VSVAARNRPQTLALRWAVFVASVATTAFAGWLFFTLLEDDWSAIDTVRLVLSSICVFWIVWGSTVGVLGLLARSPAPPPAAPATAPLASRTAILMPIYNEDPASTFARVAAVSASLARIGAAAAFDIFILSDTQSLEAAAREALWLERLLTDSPGREQIFYRRRAQNSGRKAGNIEDFIRHSGGAYDYALVLDADSLMEARAIVTMVREMEASPELGLLQTLPQIVHARSVFGRAMQFAATFYAPVFARGTAMVQGNEGPYWGHNAIFRIRAFAQNCGLPPLRGKPPFGGQILSHDYVEAALLARGGYAVRLDPTIDGSFEEGPDNLIDFAKRDQRWCQGNLQHSRVVLAPAFPLWNRVTLLQGIGNYLMPLIWLCLLVAGVAAADLPAPLRPFGGHLVMITVPDWSNWALLALVLALLILPKLMIAIMNIASGKVVATGGAGLALLSVFAEIVLSTVLAPIVLMFQIRALFRIILGFDGGWPPSNRNDGVLTVREAWAESWWVTCCGLGALAVVTNFATPLDIWAMPVCVPLILAPLVIAATSRPVPTLSMLWRVPSEAQPAPVMREWSAIYTGWTGQ